MGHIATLGDDADEMGDQLPSVDLGTGRTATSLTLGASHSCAILDDSSVRYSSSTRRARAGNVDVARVRRRLPLSSNFVFYGSVVFAQTSWKYGLVGLLVWCVV